MAELEPPGHQRVAKITGLCKQAGPEGYIFSSFPEGRNTASDAVLREPCSFLPPPAAERVIPAFWACIVHFCLTLWHLVMVARCQDGVERAPQLPPLFCHLNDHPFPHFASPVLRVDFPIRSMSGWTVPSEDATEQRAHY